MTFKGTCSYFTGDNLVSGPGAVHASGPTLAHLRCEEKQVQTSKRLYSSEKVYQGGHISSTKGCEASSNIKPPRAYFKGGKVQQRSNKEQAIYDLENERGENKKPIWADPRKGERALFFLFNRKSLETV